MLKKQVNSMWTEFSEPTAGVINAFTPILTLFLPPTVPRQNSSAYEINMLRGWQSWLIFTAQSKTSIPSACASQHVARNRAFCGVTAFIQRSVSS